MGVSLSTVNRAHMAYDHGGIKALKPKPSGGRNRENMTVRKAKRAAARRGRHLRVMFADEARFGRINRPRPCWATMPSAVTISKAPCGMR
jgi:hypothetical protein